MKNLFFISLVFLIANASFGSQPPVGEKILDCMGVSSAPYLFGLRNDEANTRVEIFQEQNGSKTAYSRFPNFTVVNPITTDRDQEDASHLYQRIGKDSPLFSLTVSKDRGTENTGMTIGKLEVLIPVNTTATGELLCVETW